MLEAEETCCHTNTVVYLLGNRNVGSKLFGDLSINNPADVTIATTHDQGPLFFKPLQQTAH